MTIHTFPIPTNLNGEQLRAELKADSVYVADELLYVVSNLTKSQIEQGLAAHIPAIPTLPTIEDKLASVGLSVTDLKTALGL